MTTDDAIKLLEAGKEFLKMQPFAKYSKAIGLVLDNLSYIKAENAQLENRKNELMYTSARLRNDVMVLKECLEVRSKIILGLRKQYDESAKTNTNVELAYRLGALNSIDATIRLINEHTEMIKRDQRLYSCELRNLKCEEE